MKKIFLIFLIISPFLFSQNYWTEIGSPPIANTASMSNHNGNLYLISSGGFYRSTNYGDEWIRILQNNPRDYTIDDSLGIIYLLNEDNKIYKSTNYGDSWIFLNLLPFEGEYITVVNSSLLFVGSNAGAFYSTDFGNNWFVSYSDGGKVHLHPSGNIFLKTNNNILVSSDLGSTWNELLSSFSQRTILTFEIFDTLLITTYDEDYGFGHTAFFLISNNQGNSWNYIHMDLNYNQIISIPNCSYNEGKITIAAQGNLYYSNWNDSTWNIISTPYGGVNWVISPSLLEYFICTKYGVLYSNNNGTNWLTKNSNLKSDINCLLVDSSFIYAGTYWGLYKSSDQGNTWSDPLFFQSSIKNLYLDNNIIYAFLSGGGVYKSTDNGEVWNLVTGLADINDLKGNNDNVLFAATNNGVFKTLNGGINWSYFGLAGETIYCLEYKESFTNNILYAGIRQFVVYTSDNGNSWIYSFPFPDLTIDEIVSINSTNTLVVINLGVYTLGGDSYNEGLPSFYVDPLDPPNDLIANNAETLFLNTYDGIYTRYPNLPQSIWTSLMDSLYYKTASLALDDSGYVYCGTFGGGLWRTKYSTLPNKSVTVITPNGQEYWSSGDSVDIQWSSINIDSVKIQLSLNDGIDWTTVVDGTPSDGSYEWVVQAAQSSNECLIKISDLSDNTIYDRSDATFTITAPNRTVTVIIPNGMEYWFTGDTVEIKWQSSNVNSVKIQLSLNDGIDWTTIVESTPSDSSYEWIVQAAQTSYECIIKISDLNFSTVYDRSDTTFTIEKIVNINDDSNSLIPKKFALLQNFPNPFNPSTQIKYQLPENNFVTLKVYDVLGNEVATLINEEKPVGSYEVEFNANDLSSGIYFYQLLAGSFMEVKKMILIK